MISFDNSIFFSKEGFDLENKKIFKENLNIANDKSQKLLKEYRNGTNEILQSFTSGYQKKIRNIKKRIYCTNKKKVVIGLGGSSSGAKALSFYMRDDIIYFDNLDYAYLKNFFQKENIENYYFFVISKSGNTFETLAILNLLIFESRKYKNFDISNSMVIITEDKDSLLKSFSKKYNIKFLEHNPNIGGRFSILSETGMLPFLDKDIITEDGSEKFLNMLSKCNDKCSPVKNAAIIFTCMKEKKTKMYCNLIYNYRLKHFSYWFHQLHAESLGKNENGMTPITSICPKDHHSMMQLFLDGPKDKLFNIFSPPDENYYEEFINLGFRNIENFTPLNLLKKQFNSVVKTFFEKNIPHRVINISDHKNPINLIELFSYFILETILLGYMMNINPYDQPAVQLIKDKIFKN